VSLLSLVCLRFCVTDLWPIVKRKGCTEFSKGVTFGCFGGEDRLGGRGTRNATCGRTAYCLALHEIFVGFEGRHLLSLQSSKAIWAIQHRTSLLHASGAFDCGWSQACLAYWRSKFSAMLIHIGLVVDEEAIGQDFSPSTSIFRGTRWRSRLRHYVTTRKVAGSIPDGVNRICY